MKDHVVLEKNHQFHWYNLFIHSPLVPDIGVQILLASLTCKKERISQLFLFFCYIFAYRFLKVVEIDACFELKHNKVQMGLFTTPHASVHIQLLRFSSFISIVLQYVSYRVSCSVLYKHTKVEAMHKQAMMDVGHDH